MQREKIQLVAKIYNNEREAEIYDWLALIVPDYGTKPFNKRFETWLNKQSSDRFGTETIKNWGMNGEDKTYPAVSFYLTKSSYSDNYELSINYKGKALGYNYDTKEDELRTRSENEKLFGITDAANLIEWAQRVAPNRRENIVKMQHNLKYLPSLKQKRDDLQKMIDEYNDKISYAISDSMRIK